MTTLLTSAPISPFALGILFLILVTYFVINYLVYLRQTKRWEQSNIPFLKPTFLLGDRLFLNVVKYALAVPLDQIYRETPDKDLIGFFIGTIPVIMLKDRKLIREISVKYSSQTFATGLSAPESDVEAQYTLSPTIDEGKWKFSRTVLAPVFSFKWFQGQKFERMKETIRELSQNVAEMESLGSVINITKVIKTAVLDISASNFGIASHSHSMKDDIRSIADELFGASFHKLVSFFAGSFIPSLQRFDNFKIFPREVCTTMSEILTRQTNERNQMNIETGDFIDLLQSLKTKQVSNNSSSIDSGFSPPSEDISPQTRRGPEVNSRQMTGLGLVLITGGAETSCRLVEFAIHSLSLYPKYQHKIRREIHETLKNHKTSEFSFEIVRSLSFTYQCLFETARLFSNPYVLRQCLEDFQIQGTNYTLKKGDRLLIPLYSLGRDEAQFRDPHSFIPERFDCKDSHLTAPGTLPSFGFGPRKCPGYQHGIFIAAVLLATIVYKYEIKPHSHLKLMDASDFNPKGFLVSPRREVFVHLVRYENFDDI